MAMKEYVSSPSMYKVNVHRSMFDCKLIINFDIAQILSVGVELAYCQTNK